MNMKNKKIRLLVSFLIALGIVFIAYLLYLFISFLISIIGILAFPIFIGSILFIWLVTVIYNYLDK
jgi:hypothetical protein